MKAENTAIRVRKRNIRSNEEIAEDWIDFINLRKKRNGKQPESV